MIDDKIVYWLENGRGNKYHLYRDCYYMGVNRPDARSGSVTQAKAAGHAEACKVCEERAEKQEELGEDFSVNTVYWRYGSDEAVWHLYENCPRLAGAAADHTLCSGRVEAAINTGRSKVCPVCKERSDKRYREAVQNRAPMPSVKQETESIPERRPAPESIQERRPETKPISERGPAVKPHEMEKAEIKSAPAAASEKKESSTKDLLAVVAVLALLCGFVWWQNNPPHTSIRSTKTAAAVSEYSEAASTKATPRPTARPTATPKPTAAPVNEDSYTVYITRTGSKYHRSGCSYLKSKIAIEKKDAIAAGYTPCSRCNP